MKDRYVVDTNVLIAASAGDPGHQRDIDATPSDPHFRMKVWEWLDIFSQSESRLVLDFQNKIYEEYKNKLRHSDFGIQVIMHKFDKCAVDMCDLEYDCDGHAILPQALQEVIHDLADRKIVAAALESHHCYNEGCVAFAGDTDWHDWEDALHKHNVLLEPIIEAWSRKKHAEKLAR